MESLIGGKSRQIVLAAIKSLHPILLKTWPESHSNRIAIDTGAFATGRLTCLVLQETEQNFLTT